MKLPFVALHCARAFRSRAIRTNLASQRHRTRPSSPRSTTTDPRQSRPEQASRARMMSPPVASHRTRAFRLIAIRTSLALQFRSFTQPPPPRGRRILLASVERCSLRTHLGRQARNAASPPRPVRHMGVPHAACKAHSCPLPLLSTLHAVAPLHAQTRSSQRQPRRARRRRAPLGPAFHRRNPSQSGRFSSRLRPPPPVGRLCRSRTVWSSSRRGSRRTTRPTARRASTSPCLRVLMRYSASSSRLTKRRRATNGSSVL